MEIAIDTSTEMASIALSHRGEVEAEMTWPSGQNQTVELLPNLLHLLQQAKRSLDESGAIIVAKGPGSFNGLRVGVGTAKGLAFALGIPLVGIGTLEAEAFPHAATGLPICPVQDAAKGEIATALYQLQEGQWHHLCEEHITTVDGLCSEVATGTIICGRLPPHLAPLLETWEGKPVELGIRPEDLAHEPDAKEDSYIPGEVEITEALGNEMLVYVKSGDHTLISRRDAHVQASPGDEQRLVGNPRRIHIFDVESGRNIAPSQGAA